jgi:hypothetical protein
MTMSLSAQETPVPCAAPRTIAAGEVSGPEREWRRAAEVVGSAPISSLHRRTGAQLDEILCADGVPAALLPWMHPVPAQNGRAALHLLPLRNITSYNSDFPDDRNNGAVWAGRGLSTAISIGVRMSAGPLTAAIQPVIAWQQNSDFVTVDTVAPEGFDSLTYPWRRIDWPQRFGHESYSTVDPGQSYVRLDARGVALGVSTENLWWGPGQRNSIIMGNTAAGFPHVFFGSAKPFNVGIGKLNLEGVWGQLEESEYFDTVSTNNNRVFTGLTVTFEPRGLTGLQLGLNRVYTHIPDSVAFKDYFLKLIAPPLKSQLATPENPEGGAPDDQIASVFARWVLPAADFEVYAEWAKADHNVDFWDFAHEPEQAQGYTLGFQKIVAGPSRWFRLHGELTHLSASTTFLTRGNGRIISYYVHGRVKQGYTHRGQILGAWVGPGGNTAYLGADVMGQLTTWGGYLERTVHDNDSYHRVFAETYRRHGHDTEVAIGARGSVARGAAAFSWRAGYTQRRNRLFIDLLDFAPTTHPVATNLSLEFAATVGL